MAPLPWPLRHCLALFFAPRETATLPTKVPTSAPQPTEPTARADQRSLAQNAWRPARRAPGHHQSRAVRCRGAQGCELGASSFFKKTRATLAFAGIAELTPPPPEQFGDATGRCDPYVMVSYAGITVKSKTISKTRDPAFNERLTVTLPVRSGHFVPPPRFAADRSHTMSDSVRLPQHCHVARLS